MYSYCGKNHQRLSNFYNLPVLGGIILSIWNFWDLSSLSTHVVQLWPIFDCARNHEGFCLYQNAKIESLATRFLEFDWRNLQLCVLNFLRNWLGDFCRLFSPSTLLYITKWFTLFVEQSNEMMAFLKIQICQILPFFSENSFNLDSLSSLIWIY